MKKNTKVAISGEKKLQRKKELERIANKELTVFTVGLVAEVILMFFYSALKSTVQVTAGWVLAWGSLAFLLVFAGLLIWSSKAKENEKKAKSLKNWAFCSLAFAAGSLFISMGRILSKVSEMTGMDTSVSFLRFFTVGKLAPRYAVVWVMIAVAVYVVAAMIYFAVKSAKVKKSR